MRIYRLKVDDKHWYCGYEDTFTDEDNSPIFTNRDRAEKRLRDIVKLCDQNINIHIKFDGKKSFIRRYKKAKKMWLTATIKEYEMVPVDNG